MRRAYTSAAEMKADFASGALHPGDLKPALARQLNAILQPVRDHFEQDDRARDLLKQVKVSSGLHRPLLATYVMRLIICQS
jgi:tyrosyl-tRNA synthetase